MAIQQSFNELSLFAGAGGGILGGKLLGWRTVCAVERDAYSASVLAQRQNDGALDPFPIWSDVTTFNGQPWNGIVDVVSGGFPCQDISPAGKSAGIEGKRSGLWSEMVRIIREVRPQYVFIENVPRLSILGLGTVLANLHEVGFDAEWGVLSAADVGAPHTRDRLWILGFDPNRIDASRDGLGRGSCTSSEEREAKEDQQAGYRWEHELGTVDVAQKISTYSGALRILHGLPHWMDRLKAIGNGQVPLCAAESFRLLMERINE